MMVDILYRFPRAKKGGSQRNRELELCKKGLEVGGCSLSRKMREEVRREVVEDRNGRISV